MPTQEDSADAFVVLSTEHDQQTSRKTSFSTIILEVQRHPNCGDEEVGSMSKDSRDTHRTVVRTWCFRLLKYRKGGASYLVRGPASSSLAPRSQAAVLWASHEHSLSTKPSWKPCLLPASPEMLQQSELTPISCGHSGVHGHATSSQDVMLRAGHGPTRFQTHILDDKTLLGSSVNTKYSAVYGTSRYNCIYSFKIKFGFQLTV